MESCKLEMEELINQSERLSMEITRDLEMPRIKRNLGQLLEAGNQMWNRVVGASANRDASEVRASVLLGARGYDYQKVSRNLDNLMSRVKHSGTLSDQFTQTVVRETDIRGFLKNEREKAIIKAIEEIKSACKDQVEKQYWHTVTKEWEKEKLEFLDSVSGPTQESTSNKLNEKTIPSPLGKKPAYNLIDIRTRSNVDEDTVAKVAAECENNGQYEDAIKLYDSISKYGKVLEILVPLLSEVLTVTQPEETERRDKLRALALDIANRYSEPEINAPRELAGTFYLLLDLMTFFNYYHTNEYNEALDIMQKLKLLPFTSSEVELKAQEFNKYPEEVRRNITEILLATMNMLSTAYKEQPSIEIRQKAKALITFSGVIQYRMPYHAIARLIELEVLIN